MATRIRTWLGNSRPAARLVVALILVFVLVGTALAGAAVEERDDISVSEVGGPKPPGFDLDKAPLANGRGEAQLRAAIEEQQEQEKKRAERLTSPELRTARERSRTEFVGLGDGAALGLLADEFGSDLQGTALPDLADLAGERTIQEIVDDHTVVLAGKGDRPPAVVESPLPVVTVDGEGRKQPVDLSLAPAEGGFAPANAVVDVRLPQQIEHGIDIGGMTITPAGAADGEVSGTHGDQVVYANAQIDTDVAVKTATMGAEVFWQLRSPRAPEELTLDLAVPEGAVVERSTSGSIEIVRDSKRLASVSRPVVVDAQGQDVPVAVKVRGKQVVLSITHRESDVAYPLLVDPVIENWWGNGSTAWYTGNDEGLNHWFAVQNGNIPPGTYSPRYDCHAPVSCYMWPGLTGPDGLHMYVRPSTTYPAGSSGLWLYQPPGTTTRIDRADFGAMYNTLRTSGGHPGLITGIWNNQGWVSNFPIGNDISNYWYAHFGGSAAGPQQLVFGYYSAFNSTLSNWRDAYMGAAIVYLTDPEAPTITSVGSYLSGASASSWVKEDDQLEIRPTATDAGLGIQEFRLTGTDVEPDTGQTLDCDGTSSDVCPAQATTSAPLHYIGTEPLPDGRHNLVQLQVDDPLNHTTTQNVEVKIDRTRPVVDLSGDLWAKKENPPGSGTPAVQPGSYDLEINAQDLAPTSAPTAATSGVKTIIVKVDGDIAVESPVPCSAGGCERDLEWTLDTSTYSGKRTVRVEAIDEAGNVGSKTFVVNLPTRGEMAFPVDGQTTSSRLALQAQAYEDGFSGAEFQYREVPSGTWKTIGGVGTMLRDDGGNVVTATSHPLDQSGRKTKKLIWDAKTAIDLALLTPKPGAFQVRAVLSGNGGHTSKAVNVELDEKGLTAGNAQEEIGPGGVDLLTGNFSYSATDAVVSLPVQDLTLSRAYNSLDQHAGGGNSAMGPGWVLSAPVEGVSSFSSLTELKGPGIDGWVDVFDLAGAPIRFERLADDTFRAEPGFEDLELAQAGGRYTLTDLDGTVTTFEALVGSNPIAFVPSKVEQADQQGVSSFKYQLYAGKAQLKRIIAPAAPSVECAVSLDVPLEQLPRGCNVLEMDYSMINLLSLGQYRRLAAIRQAAWNPATGAMAVDTVAQFIYYDHPSDASNPGSYGRLKEAWDPRITPALKEHYSYDSSGRLAQITSAGEAPWSLAYVASGSHANKLSSIERSVDDSGLDKSSLQWGHPVSGTGAAFDMSASALDRWGQSDRPTDATVIVDHGPSDDFSVIHYLNQDGLEVNTAKPGVGITTAEHDRYGNIIRELSAENRSRALNYPGDDAMKLAEAQATDTQRMFSTGGQRLLEELGPRRSVKRDSGSVVQARSHSVTTYDEGLGSGQKARHLPTTIQVGAKLAAGSDVDVRTTRIEYDWTLRKPTNTIRDAETGGLNLAQRTSYNSAGLETSSSQPRSSGTDAGTTQTIYFGDTGDTACAGNVEWFNLPCKIKPAAQPGTAGQPELPVTTYTYDRYGNVATATETVGSASRTTTSTYDAAGRKLTEAVGTAGADLPNGLVAAYGFEEGTGSTVADGSGLNNTGTISGASWATSGKYGKALDFDGSNDKITVADSSSLDLTTGMTLEAWVKPDATSGWRTALMKESPSYMAYGLYARTSNGGKPSVELDDNGAIYGSSALTTGAWAHLAATFNGSTMRLYVNGTEVASQSATDSLPNTSSPFSIGGNGVWGEYFDGLIDEVRVYNRALTAQEIQDDRDTSVSSQTQNTLGEPVSMVTYEYSSTTGKPTRTSTNGGTVKLDMGYDNAGRVTSYTDADGVESTTAYDNLDRPIEISDDKGTRTYDYDSTTGLLTSMTDAQPGFSSLTFTASYDADGRIVSKGYPNGMQADTTYDASGAATMLKYTKTTNCSSSCVWVDEQVAESIHGQWRTHSWELSNQEYAYDKAGRLTNAQDDVDAPSGIAGCTIRSYTFDANSNRTSMNTKTPGSGGACNPSASGATTSYSYDDADRLTGAGVKYDKLGRTRSLPSQYAGGGALTYAYYANDQVKTVSQDGVTKSYTLDPSGRQRQSGGLETFHYQDGSDSPSWTRTVNGSGQEVSWERNIEGIEGDLAAVRTHTASTDTTTLQLQNLHGDVIATASTDPQATALTAKFEADEFGNPRQTSTRRYGWLGGKQRRTELPSGVIQMGARSYVPALGRFSTVDPVVGGSANDYDYANQDPVNQVDLDGRCAGPVSFLAPVCIRVAVAVVVVGFRFASRAGRVAKGVRRVKWAGGAAKIQLKNLVYSSHSMARMHSRGITRRGVRKTLKKGTIYYDPKNRNYSFFLKRKDGYYNQVAVDPMLSELKTVIKTRRIPKRMKEAAFQ